MGLIQLFGKTVDLEVIKWGKVNICALSRGFSPVSLRGEGLPDVVSGLKLAAVARSNLIAMVVCVVLRCWV